MSHVRKGRLRHPVMSFEPSSQFDGIEHLCYTALARRRGRHSGGMLCRACPPCDRRTGAWTRQAGYKKMQVLTALDSEGVWHVVCARGNPKIPRWPVSPMPMLNPKKRSRCLGSASHGPWDLREGRRSSRAPTESRLIVGRTRQLHLLLPQNRQPVVETRHNKRDRDGLVVPRKRQSRPGRPRRHGPGSAPVRFCAEPSPQLSRL